MSIRSSSPPAASAGGPVSPVAETAPAMSWNAEAGFVSPAGCPSESVILALWEGRLPVKDRTAVEDHLARCALCRELVSALAPTSGPRSEPSSPAAPVAVGEIVADKYEIERVLGQGGMGWVVRAQHRILGKPVALKFLLPAVAQQPEALVRFHREARAAAMIDSEHVVRVLDAGRLPTNGAPYLVMEYLEGTDLAALVRGRGPLPVEEALDYARQACTALALAHERGIVHRDVKPANLFLVRKGDRSIVKVLDFGIAKVAQAVEATSGGDLTTAAAIMGSPKYMAPEQMQSSKAVDARTDVWAMGVVLYELLTGTLPFEGTSLPAICMAIVSSQPRSVRELRPELPPAVDVLVKACLEKDADKRIPSMPALVARIDAVRSAGDPTLPSAPPPDATPAAPLPEVAVVSAPPLRRSRSWYAVAAAVVALGGVGALAWSMRQPAAPAATAAAAVVPVATSSAAEVPVASASPTTAPAGAVESAVAADLPRGVPVVGAPPVPTAHAGARAPAASATAAAAAKPAPTATAAAPSAAATAKPATDVRREGLTDRN